MQAKEILEQYAQIEYLSITDDKWYKLMDYYPFAFPLENEDSIVVLDMGGAQGSDFGHFKIQDNGLWRQAFETHEWVKVTDIRICQNQGTPYIVPKMTAGGEPFKIGREPA
jgi:hypothetical protein